MALLRCPYLSGEVELTDERERHITAHHPELLPEHRDWLIQTVGDPDEIRVDGDYPHTRLFLHWYNDVRGGKYVVVAVVSGPPPSARNWIVTAFLARRPPKGELEWKRP